ncbi:MAG: hypothetical protein IKJ55_04260 [Clostridia bacterium]|nr:hypothetical protein [Clostridia bacterium]
MKKSCAVKLLAVALVLILTMSTGLSAMAASVTSLTRYNGDVVDVTTQVTGLDEESMVTYLVTDNTSLAATSDSTIKAIDQVNVGENTAVEFGYTTTTSAIDTDKIYVGADTWNAAVESGKVISANGANVKENGMGLEVPHAANMNLIAEDGDATAVALTNATSDKVAYVTVNDVEVDFSVKDADEIYVFEALDAEDVINIGYKAPYFTAASVMDSWPETLVYNTHFIGSNQGDISGSIGPLNATQYNLDAKGSYGDALKGWYPTSEAKTVEFQVLGSSLKKILLDEVNKDGAVIILKTGDTSDKISTASKAIVDAARAQYTADDAATLDDATRYPVAVDYSAGQQWVMHLGTKNTMTIELDVPVAGTYTMAFHQGAWATTRLPVVTVNGGAAQTATMYSEITGGEGDAGCISTVDVVLNKGVNTFTLKSASSIVRLDSVYILNKDSVGQETLDLMNQNRKSATRPVAIDRITGYNTFADTVVSLGKVVRTENSVTAFARVSGAFDECGIEVGLNQYKALAVGGSEDLDTKGAYAIELYSDNAEAITALVGETVQAYAISGEDLIYSEEEDTKIIE